MALPGGLTTISVTASFPDVSGVSQAGSVSFTPTSAVNDPAGRVILTATAVTETLSSGSLTFPTLVCTGQSGLTPLGWAYNVSVNVPGAQQTFLCYLPSALGSTVDLSALAPVTGSPAPSGIDYLPNTQAPPSIAPTNGGGFLYAENGALYWFGSSGTRTLIAPS